MREYEGEVGSLVEDSFGGLVREPTGKVGEWVGTRGRYENKIIDMIGLPATGVPHHPPDMKEWLTRLGKKLEDVEKNYILKLTAFRPPGVVPGGG